MHKQYQKRICQLTGYFLGWGDNRTPHRYIKLATNSGDLLVKVAKSLRPLIQDWQPGRWLTLISQERIDLTTGAKKIKVKQLLAPPQIQQSTALASDQDISATTPIAPTIIRVCQGSSCRRSGSEKICRSMQAYLTHNDLTERVQIETVKCLHQCKAAPHAIVHSPDTAILPGKTHYRQLQAIQVPAMLAKHFPMAIPTKQIGADLIEKIGN
jgi:Thioredoxin-like [2Fe-2S] ferredoxin